MTYRAVCVYAEAKTGEDRLGNPVAELSLLVSTRCRMTPWTAEETQILGRDFTVSHRKCLVFIAGHKHFLHKAAKIETQGETYNVERVVTDTGRWAVLHVRRWRP